MEYKVNTGEVVRRLKLFRVRQQQSCAMAQHRACLRADCRVKGPWMLLDIAMVLRLEMGPLRRC